MEGGTSLPIGLARFGDACVVKIAGAGSETIVLLTGNSLCHNPRAMKEAAALAGAGYRVQILGAWLDGSLKARDRASMATLPFDFIPVLDATREGAHDLMVRFAQRARQKATRLAHDITGWQSGRQLGITVDPLLRYALQHPADLYIAHSEPGLYVAGELLRQGRRVAVDMEDWFSEDLLPETRRHRPLRLLQSLERGILSRGACAFCPSHALAAALAVAYGGREPTVVYNAFPWSDRVTLDGSTRDRRDRTIPSIYWFSQTVGPGRGIEDLLTALPLMRGECEMQRT